MENKIVRHIEVNGITYDVPTIDGFDLSEIELTEEESKTINKKTLLSFQNTRERLNNLKNKNNWEGIAGGLEFIDIPMTHLTRLTYTFRESNMKYMLNFDFANVGDCLEGFTRSIIYELSDINIPKSGRVANFFARCTIKSIKNNELKINVGWMNDKPSLQSGNGFFDGATFPSYTEKVTIEGDRIENLNYYFRSAIGTINKFYCLHSENITSADTFDGNINEIYIGSLENCKNFSRAFNNPKIVHFSRWKQGNVIFSYKISPESIRYTLDNAMTIEEGATSRTLTLHANAKANFIASFESEDAYNAYIEEIASTKDITIA
jgi:hypothetical protein